MRRVALGALAFGAVLLSGCGGAPGDILGLGISGGFQRNAVRMHVEENGRASCNKNDLHQLPSAQILDARNVVRDAKTLAQSGASFGTPSSGQRNFQLRTPDGTVNWTESAPGRPPVVTDAEELALELERELC